MSKAVSKKMIQTAVIQGIVKAQKDYEKLSGFVDLIEAPEYFITCSIASKIHSIGSCYVTLEDQYGQTLSAAGAAGSGKKHHAINGRKRSDIVVWYKKDEPRVIVEVKHPIRSATKNRLGADIEKIKASLQKNHGKQGSVQFGVLAFYTSYRTPKRKYPSSEEKIKHRLEDFRNAAEKIVGENFRVTANMSKPVPFPKNDGRGEGAWAAAAIFIERKKS